MIRCCAVVLASLVSIVLVGCEPPAASMAVANAPPGPPALVPVTPPPAPPLVEPASNPSTQVAESSPAAEFQSQATAELEPAANEPPPLPAASQLPAPQVPASQPPMPTAGSERFISLSAGVAVPQLLPEGTQVGVSVDYSLRGNPNSSCRYLLVVESSAGEVAVPVKLDPQGGTFQ